MKKIKAILGILSAMAIISAVELSSASALTFYPAPPNYVCNGNKVVSDDNTIMEFEDGTKIVTFEGERWDFKLSVIVNDDTEITNEMLGISEGYKIEKSGTSNNVYVISFETQEEMNKMFEQSSKWLDDGIIKNAYKQKNIYYGGFYGYIDGEVMRDALGRVNLITGEANQVLQTTYLVYNEEDVNGDANGDGEITANDAAYIARKLAEQNKKDLDYRADFNKSTDVTALDAAEVAKYLAEKSIGK